ncbi:hypothetical protein MFMK1_003266 [Metallumcola ferriviriculae]|uniref:Uncharacterized protein n=1 Tax=Metallumcola ferriviriculae TaxID=3039180 RepID=A0AAU0UT36_9FIRM|nr:hypothetical protein MFMK1_003266 [Desulfitibacteraceae bacterium MK1]
MIIKITQIQKDFLTKKVLQDRMELINEIMKGWLIQGKWQVDISNSVADEMRDLCSEMLQIIGFDEHYKLTKYGKMLEELIDIFYIE